MERLERYIHEMSSPEDALMEELTRTTNQRAVHPQMLSGHIQGRFLGMLVRMLRPHRVLEIGTFTGYSALSMAAGMGAGAILDTIEADDEQEELIRSFVERSGYGDRIRLHIGSALAVMPSLNETYDLVFIDGDKREYPAYYRMLMDEGRTVPFRQLPHRRQHPVVREGGRTGAVPRPPYHGDTGIQSDGQGRRPGGKCSTPPA